MRHGQVKIGPNFFAKVKNDYSNWKFAIPREFIQNSIDAGASIINISVKLQGGDTIISVDDNGRGMNEDTLCGKLLAIGESGKDFVGSVGGFGAAKLILYFTHKEYEIHTGNMLVKGSGADYTLETVEKRVGTRSTVTLAGGADDVGDDLFTYFANIIDMTQWHGKFILNGEERHGKLRKGTLRKELEWANIYTNKSYGDRMIVRIGGIVMFHRYVDADGKCVIIELTNDSGTCLQSSRDCLKHQYQSQLEEFVRMLTVDKRSAFRADTTYYEHFDGEKLANKDDSEVPAMVELANELAEMLDDAPPQKVKADVMVGGDTPISDVTDAGEDSGDYDNVQSVDHAPVLAAKVMAAPTRFHVDVRKTFKHDFIIKNNAQMQVPDHCRPGSFSSYSDKLVKCWAALILETYRTFGKCEPFSVGFIFEEGNVLAEFHKTSDYGRVFYISPMKVSRTSTDVRVFKKRWGFTWSMKYRLIVTAVHEYVHSCGYMGHDEAFNGKSDECMEVVLKNIANFRKCFN